MNITVVKQVFYLLAAVVGLCVTWYFNLQAMAWFVWCSFSGAFTNQKG